jgi:hypothetical protein
MRRRAAVVVATVVLVLVPASATTAGAGSIERARAVVASPYTYFDRVGDNPFRDGPDITVLQVRNGPRQVALRFWIRDFDTFASFDFDMKDSGPGPEYSLFINDPSPASIIRTRGMTPRCAPRLRALGTRSWGRGFTVRFPFRCMGGPRAFRINMLVGAWFFPYHCCDHAPDRGYTPYVGTS